MIRYVALLVLASSFARAQPLSPSAVLESVDRHHPVIAETVALQDAAIAEIQSANGSFDPELRAYGSITTGGYYDLRRLDVSVYQATPLWGASFWAGYRIGHGELDNRYPTYYSDETLTRGEVRIGASIPLWRDGPLDARRARQRRARYNASEANSQREAQALDLHRRALNAYWLWVAAGTKFNVAQDLQRLASERLAQVQGRVRAGALPEVEALEAERSLLSRRAKAVEERRGLEASSFVLGLFLRDERGAPRAPEAGQLPSGSMMPPPVGDVEGATQEALVCHPRLRASRAALEEVRISRDLARAQRAPQIDARFQYSRDFGAGGNNEDESTITLPGDVFEAGLRISLPLGLRTARGALDAAEARLTARQQRLRLQEDVLATEIRDVASAYQAALEQHQLRVQLADTTSRLAEAERQRFAEGATTLLIVNLREQSVAEAQVAVVNALRALWVAHARWIAATTCERDS
ncbi:MAG: TolC family protein [Myxococcota bacterium]